jgi:glycosyltransferase involved in cell wall biosynthesis
MAELPLVSVLFVTYKRAHLLRRTLDSFRRNTLYSNLELVVTDDGSPSGVQSEIRTMGFDTCVLSQVNRGLGANITAGLNQCKGKYIFVLQDDWDCTGPADYLANAVRVMESNAGLGLINYYGVPHIYDEGQQLSGSDEPCYPIVKPYFDGKRFWPVYTDTPHLTSRAALDFLGDYKEDRDMEECERDYEARFENQQRLTAALFPRYFNHTFLHSGAEQSYRAKLFHNRVESFLHPSTRFLARSCPVLYRMGRYLMRMSVRVLERTGVVR